MQTTRILKISQISIVTLFVFFATALWYTQQPTNLSIIDTNQPQNFNAVKIQIENELNQFAQSWVSQTTLSKEQLEKIQSTSEELFNRLQKKISIENETHFSQLRASLGKHENALAISSIYSSLQNNLNKYAQYVKQEKYPRLIKAANLLITIYQKIDLTSENQLQRQVNDSLKIIEDMGAIIRKSSLSKEQRAEVQNKLDAISTEFEMLKQVAQNNETIQREFNKYKSSLLLQLKTLPESSATNSSVDSTATASSKSKMLLIITGVMLLICVAIMWLTYYLQRRFLLINQNYTESAILEQMERVSAQRELAMDNNLVTDRFINQFRAHSDYINRRMSYGSLFQNSLPYPSVCLNGQLKVNWCNTSFITEFGIEEYKNQLENLSWDYLRKLTNINEGEPVLESMQTEQESVLDIRVKKPNSSKSRPFLMHVRPVSYQKDKYIMLYFMPMDFVENSIAKQSKAVIAPILETFKMLNEDREDQEQWDRIKETFQKANATSIYQKIDEYRTHIAQRVSELHQELQSLKNTNNNLKQQQNLYRLKFTQAENYIEKGSNAFRQIKSDFVSFAEIISHQTEQMLDLSQKYEEVSNYAQERDTYLVQWTSNLAKIEQSINSILDSQSIKRTLEDVISQLKHANKHAEPIEEIIQSIEAMQNALTRQEVHLTKMKMLLNEVDRKNIPAIGNPGLTVTARAYTEQIEKFEDSLVNNLQDAYANLQATKHELKQTEQPKIMLS